MRYVKSITFKKDYHGMLDGDKIEFTDGVNVLVGINGCGKSSVLDLLREKFGIKDTSYLKKVELDAADVDAEDEFEVKYFDFHSGDKKYSQSFGDDMMGQIQSMRASSGIGSLIQFDRTDIKKSEKSLIILDEPDRGLAPRIQREMAKLLRNLALIMDNQIIVSTHSPYIMEVADMLYSVEHKKVFKDKDEFLEEHLNGK